MKKHERKGKWKKKGKKEKNEKNDKRKITLKPLGCSQSMVMSMEIALVRSRQLGITLVESDEFLNTVQYPTVLHFSFYTLQAPVLLPEYV